jgi:opacity protein-like surface antigen
MPTLRSARSLLLLALFALPGLAAAQYAPYAPPPGEPPAAPPPPPPPSYPPPPPGYPPGYGPVASPPPGYTASPPRGYAQPQRLEEGRSGPQLSAFAGWVTSSNVHGVGGYLRVGDTASYGAEVAFAGRPGTKLALKWVYSNPSVQFVSQSFAYPSSEPFHVATNYFLVAGEKGYRKGKVEPFFGGAFGTVWYSPDSFKTQGVGGLTYHPSDTWYFAFGIAAGAKIFVAEKVALRLGIEMMAPIYFSGGAFYVGSGGSGMAVTAGVPTISGNFTAGLTFAP